MTPIGGKLEAWRSPCGIENFQATPIIPHPERKRQIEKLDILYKGSIPKKAPLEKFYKSHWNLIGGS